MAEPRRITAHPRTETVALEEPRPGSDGHGAYRTIMTGGMHFMDRYNYDTERVRRCVIQYSTPDGSYPFCTINSGPTYRPFIEALPARPLD